MILVKLLQFRMGAVTIKQHQICPQLQCVVFHQINVLCITINVCCGDVKNIQLLSLLTSNIIVTPKTRALQYYLMCKKQSHGVQCTADIRLNRNEHVWYFFTVLPEKSSAKFYSRKYLVLMDTSVSEFHQKLYIIEIKRLAFRQPHLRILGTQHNVEKNARRPSNSKVRFNMYCVGVIIQSIKQLVFQTKSNQNIMMEIDMYQLK